MNSNQENYQNELLIVVAPVIAQVIARVSGDFTLLSKLNNVSSLPPEPMWTIKQAKKWASFNYRKTYLR